MRTWTTITPTALAVLATVTLASPVRADPAGSPGPGGRGQHRLPCAGAGTATQVPLPYPLAGPPLSDGQLASVDARSADDVWFTGIATDPAGTGIHLELQHYDGRSVREVDHPRLGSYWDTQSLVTPGGKVSFSAPDDGWVIGSYQMTEELWVDDQVFNGSFPFHPLVQHWNGTRWITTPMAVVPEAKFGAGAPSGVLALAPGDAWLVGSNLTADGSSRALVEHWDGRQWRRVDQPAAALPDSMLYAVAGTAADDLYAVGRSVTTDGTERTLVEHWDGREWTVLPSPNPAGRHAALTAVSARTSDDVWAVGQQVPFDGGPSTGLAEHWDGHRWAVVPANGAGLPYLFGVHAAGPDDVYAIGIGQPRHWDGRTWSVLPTSADPGFSSGDLAVDGTDRGGVWIAGYLRTYSVLSGGRVTQNRALHVCR